MRHPYAITLVTVLALGCAGCGGSAAPAVTVTATQTATVAPTPSDSPTPESATPEPESTAPSVEASSAAAQITVPNAVGKDYQSAQDIWRAAGLHVAVATDATGANRLPVIDSNWVVLAQSPKAGAKVPADTFITATVKKYTDK